MSGSVPEAPVRADRTGLARFGRAVHLALTVAGMLALLVLLGATILGVAGRYFHINSVTWSFELLAIMFVWVTAIGTVLAEIAGENVSVDGTRRDRGTFFRIYHELVLLLVAAAMVRSGWAMLARTGYMPTPVMRLPSFTMQGIILVMGLALGAIALLRMFRIMR